MKKKHRSPDVYWFPQMVNEAGYRWVQAREDRSKGSTWFALIPAPDGESQTGMESDVFTVFTVFTGLYRTFAAVDPTLEGVLAFANRFGMLGGDVSKNGFATADGVDSSSSVLCERYETWVDEIERMRWAVEILDLVRNGDKRELSKRIVWEKVKGVDLPTMPDGPPSSHDVGDFVKARLYRRSDPVFAATDTLCRIVNDRLSRLTASRLIYNAVVPAWELLVTPLGLIGAMWLQVAQAISTRGEIRKCPECGTSYSVSLVGSKATKRFCSDPCKSKAYRKRKERARELHALGKPIKAIAKELETTAEQVGKWVG